jgi:YhcH/YjgK/YiaL family protein
MTVLLSGACSDTKTDPAKWTEDEINTWFEKKEWLNRFTIQPDASVNKKALAIAYHKNPERWQKAFEYLKTTDLTDTAPGKTELDGENLFVSVAEYIPKKREEVRFESHEKYIDIQYVIKGEELMGITTHDKVTLDEPYNEEKDITFYTFDGGDYRLATPANFLVFFPEDMHRPSISTGDSAMVKKVVIKVKVE